MGNQIVVWDPDKKSSETVEPQTFEQIGAGERSDLEEWIKQNPDILGERLFIITSEFDKFEKTQKRLDLLALDEKGKLVIVELKRDAAGTLADLQAIRYAASCSTLLPQQVIAMRAEYAGRMPPASAEREILDFLQQDDPKADFSKLDSKPRIVIAAGGFDDQQITTSVLWLRSFGVDISCVEISPYRLNGDKRLFLVPRIIIPLPEAANYVEGVEAKEIERTRAASVREPDPTLEELLQLAESRRVKDLLLAFHDEVRKVWNDVQPSKRFYGSLRYFQNGKLIFGVSVAGNFLTPATPEGLLDIWIRTGNLSQSLGLPAPQVRDELKADAQFLEQLEQGSEIVYVIRLRSSSEAKRFAEQLTSWTRHSNTDANG